VAALAEALTRMNARSAANVLSLQLTLPSIDGADSRAVITALGTLGGKKQLAPVRAFFVNFKNGGGDRAMLEALLLAAKFLLQHGGPEEHALVLAAKTDVLTHPDLAKSLDGLALEAPAEAGAEPAPEQSPTVPPSNRPPSKAAPPAKTTPRSKAP